MSSILKQIEPQQAGSKFALFNLGFRPFFLGTAIHSIIVILLWIGVYAFNLAIPMSGLSTYQWHAHEMIYGYSMAVIAGFLLTAVKNWTGIQTVHGATLAGIFALWLIARILFLFGSTFINVAALFDLLFMVSIMVATTYPIIQARNWRQLGILSKLCLLLLGNICFYLGYIGILEQGIYWSIYGGLYLVIALILTIGGRVVPFFIEKGVGYQVKLSNPVWITVSGLIVFLVFIISELFFDNKLITAYAAMTLFILYSIRLIGWYTPGIWKKPMLWSLFIPMLFINIGFLLFALNVFVGISKYIAIHALTYGGIGMITVAMMSRVSLGHTGRNINEPPGAVKYIFSILMMGSVVRVFFPLFIPDYYLNWIILSQVFWVAGFSLFVIVYLPILIKSRIDGQFG